MSRGSGGDILPGSAELALERLLAGLDPVMFRALGEGSRRALHAPEGTPTSPGFSPALD